MKISKKFLYFGLMSAVFGGVSFLSVSAQDPTINSQQIDRIISNCTLTKNTLNQLHASDALLRVNRGQIYESLSTKLMDGFNDRVANNNLNNSSLTSAYTSYNSALNNFRSDYKTYEEHLATAIGVNCLKQPVSFYDAVSSARTGRSKVHDDILKLNQFVDQYKSAVVQFENDYLTSPIGTSK